MSDETNIDSIGGDFVGGNQSIGGDKVGGDKITVGNISGSNIVIGKNNTMSVNSDTTNNYNITQVFNEAKTALAASPLPSEEKEDAAEALDKLEQLAMETEPSPKRTERYLMVLEDAAPQIAEMVINGLVAGPGAVAATAMKTIIQKWREGRA